MGKFFKILSIFIAVILLLVIAGVFVVANNFGAIIKTGVNEQGPNYLGVPISVGDVDVQFLSGTAGLSKLSIANPDGFSEANSFELNQIDLALDLNSLQSEVIVIEKFTIDGAKILAEQVGNKINLQVLKERINQRLASLSSEEPSSDSGEASKQAKIAIESFAFTNASAQVKAEGIEDQQVTIPDLMLSNIGTAEEGVTFENATKAIMDPLMKTVIDQVKKEALEGIAKKALEKELDKVLDKTKGKEKLKSLFDKL